MAKWLIVGRRAGNAGKFEWLLVAGNGQNNKKRTKDILVSSIDINNVLTDPPPTCSTKL